MAENKVKITDGTITFSGTMTTGAYKLFDSFVPKSNTVEIGIKSAELEQLLERGKMAYELLKGIMSDIPYPHLVPECLFCGCPEDYLSGHVDNCIYDRASKFLEGNQ